jgi:hypothetical protein
MLPTFELGQRHQGGDRPRFPVQGFSVVPPRNCQVSLSLLCHNDTSPHKPLDIPRLLLEVLLTPTELSPRMPHVVDMPPHRVETSPLTEDLPGKPETLNVRQGIDGGDGRTPDAYLAPSASPRSLRSMP